MGGQKRLENSWRATRVRQTTRCFLDWVIDIIAFTPPSCFHLYPFSLVAPALRNVWEESLEDSSNLDGGASVQPRIGVIPICNRWIVASFSRLNDTRFGGIETGLLYLVDVQVYDKRIEDASFGIVVRWERRVKV